MPQRGDIPINNFVRGLVTEASPLTFPPGASLDEVNFELLRDGSRRRRLGLDLEDGYGLLSSGFNSAVLEGARCQAYRWSIPNGHIDQDIGVIQIGNQIWFIDLYTANPSANILNGGNPIVATELNNDVIMTFTTLNNYLIGVANQLPQPYLFNYDPATDTVTVETAAIAIRDMWGVDDGLAVDGRPTALTPAHHYNLLNQGWLPDIQSTCGAGINAIDCTFNTFGIYPSNSDAWTYGRVEDLTSVDVKKFDPDIAGRNFVNNGNVARGHFIISLYERGVSRSNQTGFTLPVDRETGRINAIAAFAGRIFYAGILSKVVGGDSRSPNLSGTVLFSQLFENKLNLVKCYQEADPTSPDINDIVDTDGGLIQIPECGYIWALKAIKESLFVFASNGVWEIRGGDNGFTATSFMVHKISNVGVYAPKSIVEVEGIIYFWAATGIHAIGRNENGVFQTSNLTIPTIQKLYNAIPDASKKNARGYYDLAQNRARWLYYSPETKEFGEAIDIDEIPIPVTAPLLTEGSSTTLSGVAYYDIIGYSTDAFITAHFKVSTSPNIRSYVGSISGTTPSGADVLYKNEPSVPVTGDGSDIAVIKFDNNTILEVHGTNQFPQRIGVIAGTLSGTTYTTGSIVYPYTSTGASGIHFRLIKLTETKAVCVFYDASRAATASLKGFVISVSGTTVTCGSVLNITATSAVNNNIVKINDTTVLLVWEDGTLGRSSKLLTISGNTLSEGSIANIANWADTPVNINVHLVNNTRGYIHYIGNTKSRVRYFTLASNTITVSAYLEISSNTLGGGTNSSKSILLDNDYLLSTYQQNITNLPYINISKVFSATSNTSITPIVDQQISSTAALNQSENIRLSHVSSNKYIVAWRSSSNVLNFKVYTI